MARKQRVWYEGVAYHITNRGNHRNDVFKDEADFTMYLLLLNEVIKYFTNTFQVVSYCLMTNHVHMLIKTTNKPLGEFMKRINMLYAIYFNKKYSYVGHLYQDRYYCELIEDDKQMLETSRYIYLNPVRAKIVRKPEDYQWSSYREFIAMDEVKFIKLDIILNYFKKENDRQLYRIFVESAIKGSDPNTNY